MSIILLCSRSKCVKFVKLINADTEMILLVDNVNVCSNVVGVYDKRKNKIVSIHFWACLKCYDSIKDIKREECTQKNHNNDNYKIL